MTRFPIRQLEHVERARSIIDRPVGGRLWRRETPVSDSALRALRQLLSGRLLLVLVVVVCLVGPLGYAMTGMIGLLWVVPGAILWTLLFAYAAARTGRPPFAWGLAGGLICGTVWAMGELVAHELVYRRLGLWTTLVIVALAAGLGGGALVGATFGRGRSPNAERNLGLAASALGAGLGFSVGVYFAAAEREAGGLLKFEFFAVGVLVGLSTAWGGRSLGQRFRPAVLFFDQLAPYLREMAMPLAAFAGGYFCLTVAFAGLYGTAWRINPRSFEGLPQAPGFWDFVFFSLMTASTANTSVSAASPGTQALVAVEVVLGMGWLIVVFGALSAHLAPRLEAIAARVHSHGQSESPGSQDGAAD
jgi:hypothetical protein